MLELEYMEDDTGVHIMSPGDSEGTLCGVWNSQYNDLKPTRKTVVTCPVCIQHLRVLRSAKFKEEPCPKN